jgi:hypothetical protein
MRKIIRFGVLPDAEFPTCEPLRELKALIADGRLPEFVSIWACFRVATVAR